ncbi:MAG: hypothetical protein RLZZ196_3679 [Bacteroidota bacterium]|jgi:uncharacterized protein YneR
MRNWLWLAVLCCVMACSEKKTDFSGNTPLKINDFNKVFKTVELPISISDSNLSKLRDTIEIGAKALGQFVPDSVVENIIPAKDQKAILYPLLKIEKEAEYYLMLNVHRPTKDEIAVVVFSKKNVYLDYKIITSFLVEHKGSRHYGKSVSINKEPTFLVEENKMDEENVLVYEKNGWAFTENHFRLIYFDSNKKPESKTIINPLDTLATNYVYSGDYARDAKNFISLRDFTGVANKYQFFMHFEKKEGTCVGELKGLLNFNKNQATYTEKGDPCIIHFTISGQIIKIKEDGNCGNHRNMTCYFNDSYDKKRKPKKKK